MVTKVGGRGQLGIRGGEVTDEWEALIKVAARKNGQTLASFIVDVTRAAALAIVKGEPDPATVTATVPARLEDVATGLQEQLAAISQRQEAVAAALAERQEERLAD